MASARHYSQWSRAVTVHQKVSDLQSEEDEIDIDSKVTKAVMLFVTVVQSSQRRVGPRFGKPH